MLRFVHQQNLGVPVDGLKQIIEVVGNSTSENANCFHFLGVLKLTLEFFFFCFRCKAVGDVPGEAV